MRLDTPLAADARITVPIIGGAMYPCSNPELVAAVSEAGGIGVVQPIALTYVHGHEFRAGLQLIKRLTKKPIGATVRILDSLPNSPRARSVSRRQSFANSNYRHDR